MLRFFYFSNHIKGGIAQGAMTTIFFIPVKSAVCIRQR